jgi:hypothetical protein
MSFPMAHRTVGFLAAIGLATVLAEPSANACGGCFAPPGPSTQVTAHRMALAISSKRTILWDQIQYSGDPSSFGWVLPIRSAVDVGVSSDDLFQRLDVQTQPSVSPPPPPECPPPEHRCITTCDDRGDFAAPSAGGAEDTGLSSYDSGVDVWSSSVVGPYEATQLSATDGTALRNWLKDHGYTLPDAIAPTVDAYVAEGFGFLAIKLVPAAGTSRMVPIRIAFDGASPTLPLRMVAAGTGAEVGIKLFVLGEGRWEAKNFDSAEVATSALVWDWSAMGSNLGTLESSLISSHAGKVWIAETSDDFSVSSFFSGLPPGTTSSEAGTVFSTDTDQSEIARVFPDRSQVTITRLFAQLPSSALATDLELQASLGGKIPASRQAPTGVNYTCQSYVEEYCPGVSPTCTSSGGPFGLGSGKGGSSSSFGCSTAQSGQGRSNLVLWLGLSGVAALAVVVSRRRRS